MGKLIVEIKSREMIKPCTPTPKHLQTLKLSLLDQFAAPVRMPFIFYYKTRVTETADNLLRKSLSKTLVQYYPLAGRIIEGNSTINCNDQGVVYSVADVLISLDEVIENPSPEELIRLLPVAAVDENKSIVAGVQVNHFQCGGTAISVTISHKIADAATFVSFVNAWATNNSGSSSSDVSSLGEPKFDSAKLFPPINLKGVHSPESLIGEERIVGRRLIFDKETIHRLRQQGVDGRLVKGATRVELVTALLWKYFLDIAKTKPTTTSSSKILCASQAVNLRTLNKSSLIPQNYHGNLFWPAFSYASIETETTYPEAIAKLKTSVKQIDTSFVQKLQSGESIPEIKTTSESIAKGEVELCHFSSCIWFPLYEVNFGWGTPIWVSMTTLPFKNSVLFLSTNCKHGIEAWVNVLEQDAVALERQHHFFLSLASHNIRPKL